MQGLKPRVPLPRRLRYPVGEGGTGPHPAQKLALLKAPAELYDPLLYPGVGDEKIRAVSQDAVGGLGGPEEVGLVLDEPELGRPSHAEGGEVLEQHPLHAHR